MKYFCKKEFSSQFEIIMNILVGFFCFIWIPMLWVYGHYTYFNCLSAGTVLHVGFWRLKTTTGLKRLKLVQHYRVRFAGQVCSQLIPFASSARDEVGAGAIGVASDARSPPSFDHVSFPEQFSETHGVFLPYCPHIFLRVCRCAFWVCDTLISLGHDLLEFAWYLKTVWDR